MKTIEIIKEELIELSKEVDEHITVKEKKAESYISDPPDELTDEIESLESMRDSIDMAIQESPE